MVKPKAGATRTRKKVKKNVVDGGQCVIYLANSKKDITVYLAYSRAKADVSKYGNLPVPIHLRNAPTKLMKDLDYGKDYKYTPLEDSSDQTYFPE